MSASSKKKLRNAENAEKLTEKQLTEQKEAKKLKIQSAAFIAVIAAMVLFAAIFGVSQSIANSGIRERNTVALTVGEHEITSAELNYYFIDTVNQFYQNYGSYASIFGLDLTTPLDEQVTNEETGTTWADDFMDSAISTVRSVYALADAAEAAGYTLSESEESSINTTVSYLALYAAYNGYSDTESYVKAIYGRGASVEGLTSYYQKTTLATSYQNYYSESLTYSDEQVQEKEAENYDLYTSYSYNYYYLSTSKFLTGGTTDEDGTTTYTEEEKALAETAALAAAVELTNGEYATAADFDSAIAGLSVNSDTENVASNAYTDLAYSKISSLYADWITDSARQPGDTHYVASISTSTNDNGEEVTTVNGYYVLYFVDSNDNTYPLANVRHILVAFEGGTYDSTTQTTTYSDEEKAAAKEAAEELYAQWKSGEATEASFAALANEQSDDGDGTTGGLYEDVYPGQMVTNFNDWCFAEGRTAGDTGIVESEYGYHIMFYSGDSATTYRHYLITEDLRSADTTTWYNALLETQVATVLTFKHNSTDLVLSTN